MFWSFNRTRDYSKITDQNLTWEGPFSWPSFESTNGLPLMPDVEGVYLFTFEYKDGYLIYSVGITNSTKKRIAQHNREYKKGNYTILKTESAQKGQREEIWHGWNYAKNHKEEFIENQESILKALQDQLGAFRVFITQQKEERIRERIEASIMNYIYNIKEPWSDLADRGMFLRGRYNSEMPIKILNSSRVIYGLPRELEI